MDNGNDAPKGFTAPATGLFANIIEGILGGTLEWALDHHRRDDRDCARTLRRLGAAGGRRHVHLARFDHADLHRRHSAAGRGQAARQAEDRGRSRKPAPACCSPAATSPAEHSAAWSSRSSPSCRNFNRRSTWVMHIFGEQNAKSGKPEWKPDEVGWAKVVSVVMFALLGGFLLWVGSRKKPVSANRSNRRRRRHKRNAMRPAKTSSRVSALAPAIRSRRRRRNRSRDRSRRNHSRGRNSRGHSNPGRSSLAIP